MLECYYTMVIFFQHINTIYKYCQILLETCKEVIQVCSYLRHTVILELFCDL